MKSPRRISIQVSERELLDYLTGKRALQLPRGTKLVSARFEVGHPNDPDRHVDWVFSIEHESFPEVSWRVPLIHAEQVSVPQKRPSSVHTLDFRRRLSAAG